MNTNKLTKDSFNEIIDTNKELKDFFKRKNINTNEIDPQILGTIFENCLDTDDKKTNGIYYTPQEIVHYMCQESLIHYLSKEFENKINISEIENFIRPKEFIGIPKIIQQHALDIDKSLDAIRICEPSIGVGAFALGMIQEITQSRTVLTKFISDTNKRSKYHFKLNAIQNCIYGIDSDKNSLEICKIRLYLSLFTNENLKHINTNYLNIKYNLLNRDFLNKEEASIQQKFDVVIGNPPYIQLQKNGGKLSNLYKNSRYETFVKSGDVYCLFYERGIELLKPKGYLCYITSNKWMRAAYGKKLRKFFASKCNPLLLLDFGGLKIFGDATVDTNILLVQNDSPKNKLMATQFKSDFGKNNEHK